MVDLAGSKVGSTDWAYKDARPPFPAGSNKCNLFVHEMATGAGFAIPQKAHTKLHGLGSTVMLPPNAGDWASATKLIGSATVVATPEPGDIVAWAHPEYSDATGHVGIVAYPQPTAPQQKTLASGESGGLSITLQRTVIAANEDTVDQDTYHFWHYYDEGNAKETGLIVFRRLK